MAIKTIEYIVNLSGVTPSKEQFVGMQGDHRATRLKFELCDELRDGVCNTADAAGGKVMYRFDIYDGEGGIWQSEPLALDGSSVSIELEERHTRFGGKIAVYLVFTALSAVNETEVELYSFPVTLRLQNRPDGMYQDGENYESVTGLAEVAKLKADEAEVSAVVAEQFAENADKSTKQAYEVVT